MRLLLDTLILLWAAAASSRLPVQARALIESEANSVYCSTASLWEIAIKTALAKPDFRVDLKRLRTALPAMNIPELPVYGQHVEMLEQLPAIHKDPFDRILVAQSLAEPMRLLTNDRLVARYSDSTILV